MQKSLNTDTLAFHLGYRPGVLSRDVSSLPLPGVIEAMNVFMGELAAGAKDNEPKLESPEFAGAEFYLLNHAVSIIRRRVHPLSPLGAYAPLVDLYFDRLAINSARMFYYLLLICTRESRHDKSSQTSSKLAPLAKQYGTSVSKFHASLKGLGSDTAATRLRTSPPETSLGAWTNFLRDIFYTGSYSGGYGGIAWGAVADALTGFVHGNLSAEMMMDTAFTLCHNNGPIFNKGMLYTGYGGTIYKLLDVQRSGQVPQLLGSRALPLKSQTAVDTLYERWKMCRDVIGDEFDGTVDWFLVESLGSLHKYSKEKAEQLKAAGGVDPQTAANTVGAVKGSQEYFTPYLGFSVKKVPSPVRAKP